MNNSRLLSILLSLLAAFSLWLYVVTVENPIDTKELLNVPVTFSGAEDIQEDSSLIITKGADSTVAITVSGKRSAIQKVESSNTIVLVDVSRIKSTGDYKLTYTVEFTPEVEDEDISILDRSPVQISFTLEQQMSKVIEIKGVLDGEVADGYIADPMTYDFEEITIQGPASAVENISYAQVILSRTNLDKTVTATLPYALIDKDGNPVVTTEITSDVTEIEVTQPISKIKEIPLVVEFVAGGGATEENITTTITPATITVSGDAATVDGINQIVLDKIDLADVLGNTTISLPIVIPNVLKNVSGTEVATVDLKIHGLDSATVLATNVDFINTPTDYTAKSMTQALQVTLRAPIDTVNEIATKNIRVVADLTGLSTAGTYSVPVTIFVDGFTDVGILGEYSIVVSLEETEEVAVVNEDEP